MTVVHNLSDIKNIYPAVVSIGNFDGVHAGHQMLLKKLVEDARAQQCLSVVITFFNHPITILKPQSQIFSLCTFEHKVKLLKDAGVDLVVALKFTKEIAEQSAEEFLRFVQQHLVIKKLVLGDDAAIGRHREGNQDKIKQLAHTLDFEVEYLTDLTSKGKRVSSSQIRHELQLGNLEEVKHLLGRKFSVQSVVIKGLGKGTTLGFHTANVDVNHLCLPPLGVYTVYVRHGDKYYAGIANLGVAPTVRDNPSPILEVHILDETVHLLGEEIEIVFNQFVRSEKKFASLEALKEQIAKDVQFARDSL